MTDVGSARPTAVQCFSVALIIRNITFLYVGMFVNAPCALPHLRVQRNPFMLKYEK